MIGESGKRQRPSGLPLGPEWKSDDDYVQSLLSFATSSDIFRNLCGGVHILDFLTREPDLYTTVLPQEWRDWFDLVSIDEVLDFLRRRDLEATWDLDPGCQNGDRSPPKSLLEYVKAIRKHSLKRNFIPVSENIPDMPRHISVGMKIKKSHEVTNFAAYVEKLAEEATSRVQEPIALVDFGSGQNYLGRTLASPPYNKHVIAIERKHHNIAGARSMDVLAKLAKREKIMRNKKEWKRQMALNDALLPQTSDNSESGSTPATPVPEAIASSGISIDDMDPDKGSITYIEHEIKDGRLENILYPSLTEDEDTAQADTMPTNVSSKDNNSVTRRHPKAMVISLHSCGNLSHHGIRSLILNPSVCAVAMIGCCYNLLTERLGPVTYKLPRLRPNHPRLEATGAAYDPHGFPMSQTLESFEHDGGTGVRLNITARMMAVQAPYNWGPDDSEAFFRRHFYRALLQRILLDLGIVKQCDDPGSLAGGSVTGKDVSGTPLIVGSLRKACFTSFRNYVRGALAKLTADPVDGPMIAEHTRGLTDEMIASYEAQWGYAKKRLSVIWSLMAFSAGVVESIVIADRWLYLREQECVDQCWVDIVFDYKYSPRNFVVVGIKKKGCE